MRASDIFGLNLDSLPRAKRRRVLRALRHGDRIDRKIARTGRRTWVRPAVGGEVIEAESGRTYSVVVRSFGEDNFHKITIYLLNGSLPQNPSEQLAEMVYAVLQQRKAGPDYNALMFPLMTMPAAGTA